MALAETPPTVFLVETKKFGASRRYNKTFCEVAACFGDPRKVRIQKNDGPIRSEVRITQEVQGKGTYKIEFFFLAPIFGKEMLVPEITQTNGR